MVPLVLVLLLVPTGSSGSTGSIVVPLILVVPVVGSSGSTGT